MSDAIRTSGSSLPVAPPEGEHFMFDDDGERLRLIIRPQRQLAPIPLLIAFAALLFGAALFMTSRPGQLPFAGTVVAWILTIIVAAATLHRVLEQWIGYEMLLVSADRVRLETRIVIPRRTLSRARSECRKLRVVPPVGFPETPPGLLASRLFGQIGFEHRHQLIRFGTTLTEPEALAVCAFLLSRCPDLGPREEETAGTAGGGVE